MLLKVAIAMDRISAASSTKAAYGSAISRFNEYQNKNEDPIFDDLNMIHVEGEHLQKLMLDFGRYLAKTEFPYGKDGKFIAPSTKGDYFTKVKLALKEKFPRHDAWKTENPWFDELKSDIEKGAKRGAFLSTEVCDSKCMPFYPDVKDEFIRMHHRAAILHGNVKYVKDLKSLCSLLIKKAAGKVDLQMGPLQQRVWFVMTMLAMGRGGEI